MQFVGQALPDKYTKKGLINEVFLMVDRGKDSVGVQKNSTKCTVFRIDCI